MLRSDTPPLHPFLRDLITSTSPSLDATPSSPVQSPLLFSCLSTDSKDSGYGGELSSLSPCSYDVHDPVDAATTSRSALYPEPYVPFAQESPALVGDHRQNMRRRSISDSGYGGSNVSQSNTTAPRWECHHCESTYTSIGNLRRHQRARHGEAPEPSRKQAGSSSSAHVNHPSTKDSTKPTNPDSPAAAYHIEPLTKVLEDTRTAQLSSAWNNLEASSLGKAALCEVQNARVCSNCLVTQDFDNGGIATKANVDVYKPSTQTLHTNSSFTQPSLNEIGSSAWSPKSFKGLPEPLQHRKNTADTLLSVEKLAPLSIRDLLKQGNDMKGGLMDGLEAEGRTARGVKRKHYDDGSLDLDASTDASDEEEDDSDCERDNIVAWDISQVDALPSFFTYSHNRETDTPSSYRNSPESGSSTAGTVSQGTPTSSISSQSGGTGLQGSKPLDARTGPPNNSNNPIFAIKDDKGARSSKPLAFICWYAAAGAACISKNVKRSTETRYLWGDHAAGKKKGPNHLLPDKCQTCSRLFLTQELLQKHIDDNRAQRFCHVMSDLELEKMNWEPNRRGISKERMEAIQDIRGRFKGSKPPNVYDEATTALLRRRVESNVSRYINGSDTSEETAKRELWMWYLIFKQLRPDDEVPLNPFTSKQHMLGPEDEARTDALRKFNSNVDQLCEEGLLPQLSDDQRKTLGHKAFLATLEMLGVNECQKNKSAQNIDRSVRKRQRFSPPEDSTPALEQHQQELGQPQNADEFSALSPGYYLDMDSILGGEPDTVTGQQRESSGLYGDFDFSF